MKCDGCEFVKVLELGMDSYGKLKTVNACSKEPNIGELHNGLIKGYSKLYAKHLKQSSPKWCIKRRYKT